jgi:predicted nucleic acid-binding protein
MSSLLDTSVLISERPELGAGEGAISVMTLAELHVGVLYVRDEQERAGRLRRLAWVERTFERLPVDDEVARRFGEIVAAARGRGCRPGVADALIAATAITHDLELVSSDRDFFAFEGLRLRVL